jgi:hypothetical protein
MSDEKRHEPDTPPHTKTRRSVRRWVRWLGIILAFNATFVILCYVLYTPRIAPMRQVLGSASRIRLTTTYRGREVSVAYWSNGETREQWRLMREACRFDAAPPPENSIDFWFEIPASPSTYRVVLMPPFSKEEPSIRYGYASGSGKLGAGNDWCGVPLAIQQRLLRLKAQLTSQ